MATAPSRLAVVTRSNLVESEHWGHLVVADAAGTRLFELGDSRAPTILRSTAKPIQAMTCVRLGCPSAFDWTSRELAIVAASHAGEPDHLAAVRSLLAKAHLSSDDLRCGTHAPFSHHQANELRRWRRPPSILHHNCSGKHVGMLSAARLRSWPIATYFDPGHPLQREHVATLEQLTGLAGDEIGIAIDGCGVPTFRIPLVSLAQAFARLASGDVGGREDVATAACQVREAMLAEPRFVSGRGRLDSRVMEHAGGVLIAKGGAEGVYAAGLVERGLGIAIKIADGSERAHPAVLGRLLRQFLPDIDWTAIDREFGVRFRDPFGQEVGAIEAAF
ncbi:L-asparaginase II [Planctomycetes bacterium Pan216]|uniref:L-asparaginase II n=1 Tax=Kolteria novifilia TaxID=2527975 RepID=A0A518AX32_9BACT|nr:L-asparaginase II [Planctomycetes bacterium Pan216]